jgi:hypothetical protein
VCHGPLLHGNSNPSSKIEIVARSGMLPVTINPRASWLLFLAEIVAGLIVAPILCKRWTKMSLLFRVFVGWVARVDVATLIYQLSGREVVEFDERHPTVCKEIHGWERKRDCPINECSELEWLARGKTGHPPSNAGWWAGEQSGLARICPRPKRTRSSLRCSQTYPTLRKESARFQTVRNSS